MEEHNIDIREATTRHVSITCRDKETGGGFDFSGYTVQTHLSFGEKKQYAQTSVEGNVVNYKIPAGISKGEKSGVAETRIFKDGDVYEVLRMNIKVHKAEQPDTQPQE